METWNGHEWTMCWECKVNAPGWTASIAVFFHDLWHQLLRCLNFETYAINVAAARLEIWILKCAVSWSVPQCLEENEEAQRCLLNHFAETTNVHLWSLHLQVEQCRFGFALHAWHWPTVQRWLRDAAGVRGPHGWTWGFSLENRRADGKHVSIGAQIYRSNRSWFCSFGFIYSLHQFLPNSGFGPMAGSTKHE